MEAVDLYKQLLSLEPMPDDDLPPFPEARRGLELCADGFEQLGDQAYQTNQPAEAVKNYEHALTLGRDYWINEGNKLVSTRTTVLYIKLSVAALDTPDIQAASTFLASALELSRLKDGSNAMGVLANQLNPLLRDKAHYQQVQEVIMLLMDDQNKTEEFRHDVNSFSELLIPPMDKGQQQQFIDELVAVFNEKKADGTWRWTREQVEDCLALFILISLRQNQPENLDERLTTHLNNFVKRAELDTVSSDEWQARFTAYFDLHPVDDDLTVRLNQVIQSVSDKTKDLERKRGQWLGWLKDKP